MGIALALMTTSASTRPGDYCTNVQPETARKTLVYYGNAHDTGAGYLGNSVGTRGFLQVSHIQGENGAAGLPRG